MSDVAVLPTGGTRDGSGTNWLMIGGLGLGVLVILYFLTKSSGGKGQPTVAAGTSINAALGSIQEQNLNLMGQLGNAQTALGSQISGVSDQVGQVGTQVGQVGTAVGQVNTAVGAVGGQVSSVADEITQNQTALTGELTNLNTGIASSSQYTQGQLNAINAFLVQWLPALFAQGASTSQTVADQGASNNQSIFDMQQYLSKQADVWGQSLAEFIGNPGIINPNYQQTYG